MTVPNLPLHNLSPPSSPTIAPFTPLAAFGPTTPHALPLLVKLPNGQRTQVDVPPDSTVDSLKERLGTEGVNTENMNLFFGDLEMADGTLDEYRIPDVYDHVGGLLGVINDGVLDMNKKLEAVDKTCAVAQVISRGESDMEKLVSAALNTDGAKELDMSATGSNHALKKEPLSLDLTSLNPSTGLTPRLPPPPTPSQLIRKLSEVQPQLFPPSAASKVMKPPEPKPPQVNSRVHAKEEPAQIDGKNKPTWFEGVLRSFDAALPVEKCDSSTNTSRMKAHEGLNPVPPSKPTATMSDSSGNSDRVERTGSSALSKKRSNASSSADSKTGSPNGAVKVPKKRGRKRKFPELSDEERKALRQAQNRESAKQSRIRRKTMAAEYDRRISTLTSENTALRDKVSVLNNRLSFLQSLLTVTVNPKKIKTEDSSC